MQTDKLSSMTTPTPEEPKPEHAYKGRGVFVPAVNIKEYLYGIIKEKGPITRKEMTNHTGIPRTTIYDTIVKLMLDEKVRKYSVPSKKRGRPRVFYEVVPVKEAA
jgi:predicted ArsR family transcriptional regulator